MKSRILDWVFRAVLVFGLLVIPSFNISASAPQATTQTAANSPGGQPALNLSIPFTNKPPTIDGLCDAAEYGSGVTLPFDDGGGSGNASVRLMHDADWLYVCMSATAGSNKERFASLYLDPQGNGATYTFAQQDDFSLKTMINGGALSSWHGSGVGPAPDSYLPDGVIGPDWSALANTTNGDQVEYKVLLKTFNLQACGAIFGLAVYHHWLNGSGDDYGWPSKQWYDQPRTWKLATLDGTPCPGGASGKIAYVFRGDTLSATSFYNLLAAAGYTVTLIPLGNVLSYDFTTFDLTIIADDTGSLNEWSTSAADSALQVAKITAVSGPKPGGTPILGLGEGGYAFFGKKALFIGWPQGWHGPQDHVRRGGDPAATNVFNTVSAVDPVPYYAAPTNSVGIYLVSKPANVYTAGLEDPLDDHASIILQDCRMLWGNSGNPLLFDASGNGKTLFLNSVSYIRNYQCSPPPSICTTSISKTAVPPGGSPVNVGTTITYTVNYSLGPVGTPCATGKVVDIVPEGSSYVPGSATGGGILGADGALTWLVNGTGSVSFSVTVNETACAANKSISNTAELHTSDGTIKPSNTTTHPVNCQPVSLPNTQPMYAESEFKIDPYPLVAGTSTHLSVRVQNLTASPQPVTVQFQASPAVFGTGLDYSTALGSTSATVPASGYADVGIHFVPANSGIACFQAVVTAANGSGPLITQSCLDVVEVLVPGQLATLTFPVRNNTGAAGTVSLVVDNTCPGWSAVITNPGSGQYVNLAAGATGSPQAVLSVTPGSGVTLGSGCHIDVQAWIGDKMIGGIRKIDIAPVHLPLHVVPPWEEPEISFIPDPPVLGVTGQLCIQLVNPLPATVNNLTVDFSEADFGAGIGFTPAATTGLFNLPPGVHTICAAWKPASSGTLHRCVLATLKQSGYRDQTSQHNIDIVRPASGLSGLTIPFVVGNPDLVGHILTFERRLVGINPAWMPIIEPLGGGVLPGTLAGGGRLALQLRFAPSGLALAPNLAPPLLDLSAGSRQSVEVSVLLDGVPTSGFTVQLDPYRFYLPSARK